jgi:hypothetical protein
VLRSIGYWRSDLQPELPDPAHWQDSTWNAAERDFALRYLELGYPIASALGAASCRLCGAANGSQELSDGVFVWPEGLAHYIREHSVRLPDAVLEAFRRRLADLEEADVDDTWWNENARRL